MWSPPLPKCPAGLAGRSVGLQRKDPERLRSLFALVFHRWWWRGRSVREGGGSLPGNFYLPRTACTADAPSNRTCFRSQVVTLGIFSSLEFDRFRTRGELGQGRLRADCYLALPDLQTAPPQDDRSDNLLAGFSRAQFCDSVDIAGL